MKKMRKRFFVVLVMMICLTTFSSGILAYAKEKSQPQPVYYKYYTSICVESGDTLWSIAQEYSLEEKGSIAEYIQEIKKINGLKGDEIRTGEYLTIVYYSTEYK